MVIREAKKRREAEEAYAAAGRTELAEKEHAESVVLADYLPQQLSAGEISAIVADAIASTGAAELGPRGIGKVMGVVTPQTKGKADGGAVAAEVRRQLAELTHVSSRAQPRSRGLAGRRAAISRRIRVTSRELAKAAALGGSVAVLLCAFFFLASSPPSWAGSALGDGLVDRAELLRCTRRDPVTSPVQSPSARLL